MILPFNNIPRVQLGNFRNKIIKNNKKILIVQFLQDFCCKCTTVSHLKIILNKKMCLFGLSNFWNWIYIGSQKTLGVW